MIYQPFIDHPDHIAALNGQRFVVIRAPFFVNAAYRGVQDVLRDRFRGQPVSFPAYGHVTLCGLAAGASLEAVQALVRDWAIGASPFHIEIERVTWFPPPFQIPIVEVRKTPALSSALTDLRSRAEQAGLVVSTVVPVEAWRFHMSLAYCSQLSEAVWQDVIQLTSTLSVPRAQGDAAMVEVAAFDGGEEYSGGEYALGAGAA